LNRAHGEHLRRAREIVERQRQIVTEARTRRGDAGEHEEILLRNFEKSLALFEEDLAEILSQKQQRANSEVG
jgi:hypothetical protein